MLTKRDLTDEKGSGNTFSSKSQHTDQPNITVVYGTLYTEIIDIFVFYYNELDVLYNT